MIVDFHSHTTASDGSLKPAELVGKMRARGVQVYSITDHDSLQAYETIDPHGTGAPGARIVTGLEINTTYKGNDVHVLGYGVRLDDSPVRRLIDRNRTSRRDRARRMVEQLRGADYEVTLDMVQDEAQDEHTALGRPHVAKALVRAGLVRDVEAAFRTVLSRNGAGYVPQTYTTPQEAIEAIARSGGVSVLAHPGRLKDNDIIDELAESGLVGLEVFYNTHTTGQVSYYRAVATRLALVMTAGSDFHDIRWQTGGVGMDVERADIGPFLDLVAS